MIEFENVNKAYRVRGSQRVVLDRVSFTLDHGQSIGVIGCNGAGKSTLIRLISGCELPNSGRIRRRMSVSWPLGFRGGFQGSLTGNDNVRFISRIYGVSTERTMDAVRDFSELGEYMGMPVKTYSSGMRARLAFALSLAIDFECYLVDEITAVGDHRFVERCRQALLERRGRGTLVMASHSAASLRAHCDSGMVLHDGRISLYPDINEAINAYHALYP